MDKILYLFFGVCTTVINYVAYGVLSHVLGISVLVSTAMAWLIAVLFSYVTNRKFVFDSTIHTKIGIAKELFIFVISRAVTGILDWLCMLLFVEILRFNDMLIKITANIVVILLNYLVGKCIVFRKGRKLIKDDSGRKMQ